MCCYLIKAVRSQVFLHCGRYSGTYSIVQRRKLQVHIAGIFCIYLLGTLARLPVFLQRRVVNDITRQILTYAIRIRDLHVVQKASRELLQVTFVNTPLVLLQRSVKLLQEIASTLSESFILYNSGWVRYAVRDLIACRYLVTDANTHCSCLRCIHNARTYCYIVPTLRRFADLIYPTIYRGKYSCALKCGWHIEQTL